MVNERMISRIRAAVSDLPEVERHAIELAITPGVTYRQVAQLTGVPETVVLARIRIGLRRVNQARLNDTDYAGPLDSANPRVTIQTPLAGI